MKKIFLSVIMLAGVYTLSAQQVPTYQATDVNFAVPVTIKTNFQATYPSATTVTWQPMNDWWYATYKDENNRLVSVYYNTQPYYLIRNETFKVALPVLNTLVPETVITNAINKYGNSLYSITAMKPAGSEAMNYQVTLIQNGMIETVMMNESNTAMNTNTKSTPMEQR